MVGTSRTVWTDLVDSPYAHVVSMSTSTCPALVGHVCVLVAHVHLQKALVADLD